MTLGQPSISVDALVFRVISDGIEVLLSKRWAEPYAGEYALPGVLLKTNESISEAAERALSDKLNIEDDSVSFVKQFRVFDDTNRDPRGATVSVTCFAFLRGEVESSGRWTLVDELGELPFDHNAIINEAVAELSKLSEHFVYGLLGESFTTGDYLNLAKIVDFKIDGSNAIRIIPVMYQNVSKVKVLGRKTLWGFSEEYVDGYK